MKAIATFMLISMVGCSMACNGQTSQSASDSNKAPKITQKDTVKQMNLLDEQTKMFGQIFD